MSGPNLGFSPQEPVFFHIDLDAFYAAVEQRDNADYRGRPVIIGALPGHRGVVSACSYEARKYGIHSAMPISQAYRLCRNGVYLVPRMKLYQQVSKQVMEIFKGFSPTVHQISIDEATLDMTGTRRLLGIPEDVGRRIKEVAKKQSGLTLSIGIAPNRYLAKLASEFDKPDGLCRVLNGQEEQFLDQLELKALWGLGKKTLERMEDLNITTVQTLRSFPEGLLQAMLGKAAGTYLYRVCRGIDPGIYSLGPRSHSISSEMTFGKDTKDREGINRVLLDLSHQIMFRAIGEDFKSKTIHLKVRFSDFSTTTVQTTLRHYVSSAEEIYDTALRLLDKRWQGGELIRLIGLGLTALENTAQPEQNELFEDPYDKKKKVEEAVFSYHKSKKGANIVKASLLNKRMRSFDDDDGLAPVPKDPETTLGADKMPDH